MPNDTLGMNDLLLVEREGAVARLTLNRPDVHNAFNETLIAEITNAVKALSLDDSVRVIVVAGAGKSFCAGADLGWMQKMATYSKEENVADARKLQEMFETIYLSPKATIARVHGAAMGGGLGLAAVCDIVVASPAAQFAFTEARLGMAPAVVSPYVVRKIGSGNARAFFLTAERMDAATALRIGLCHVVTEDLDSAVAAKIDLILQNGPEAVATCKTLIADVECRAAADVGGLTSELIASLRVSPEGQEGIRAFLEKRKPKWAE